MRFEKYFLIVYCFLFAGTNVAQVQKNTLKILFVGNSYTYYEDMPQQVSAISDDSTVKLITEKSTVGGARLREHWLEQRGLKTKELIKKGKFDIVVLQGHSMVAIKKPDSLRKYSKLFSDLIKKSGAKPYFYLTWAREYAPHQQKQITKVYTEVANSNSGVLVPVADAWVLAKKQQATIELYDLDGSHPSLLGAYLTAHLFVVSILNEVPKNTSPNDSKDFLFLRKIAREFLKK